mgnify:FL=1
MAYFYTEDDVHIYYKEIGDKNGKPIIALHGWNSTHAMFDNLLSGMADYRCIALDFRGVGRSSLPTSGVSMGRLARDVEELILHLGLSEVTLIGYSMGASVLYKYIELFGTARLYKTIICEMSPKLLNDGDWDQGLGQGTEKPMDNILAAEQMFDDYPAFFRDFNMKHNPALAKLPEAVLDNMFVGMLAPNTDYVAAAFYLSFLLQDYRPMLHKIDVPTGIFFADPGSVYQPKTAYYLEEKIPAKTKVVIFAGCTHLFGLEKPDLFLKEVRAFMAEDM